MNILSVKEASLIWNISVRRINTLCNQGRISGAIKKSGIWLIPTDAQKPEDLRVKSGIYKDWRNKSNMKSDNFDNNLKNLKATFAIENMNVSEKSIDNLKRIEKGEVTYTAVIEELKQKYMQRV